MGTAATGNGLVSSLNLIEIQSVTISVFGFLMQLWYSVREAKRYFDFSRWLKNALTALAIGWLPILSIANADDEKALVLNAEKIINLTEHADKLIENGQPLRVHDVLDNEEWSPVNSNSLLIGGETPALWLRIKLINSLAAHQTYRFDTGMPLVRALDAWVIRENNANADLIITSRWDDGFNKRSIPHRQLISEFILAPTESLTLVIRIEHDFSRVFKPRILTARSGATEDARAAFEMTVMHALLAFVLLLAVFGRKIVGAHVALAFVAYVVSALLFILSFEQNLFRFIWPEHRAFDLQVWFGLLNLLLAAQLQFGRTLFDLSDHYPRFDRIVLTVVILNLVYALIAFFTDHETTQTLDILETLRLLGSVLLHFVIAILAVKAKLTGAIAFATSGAIIVLALFLRVVGIMPAENLLTPLRVFFLAESAAFIIAMIQRAAGLMRERDDALAAEMTAVQRELVTSKALVTSERVYGQTRLLAEKHAMRLASISHDIVQPLSSLRQGLDGARADGRQAIEDALDYLTNLAENELNELENREHSDDDSVDLQTITDRVVSMFQNDIEVSDMIINYEPLKCQTEINPLALMRILANILSNAIRHSDASNILFKVSAKKDNVVIEISDDGKGMTEEIKQSILNRHVRHSSDRGHGLGLSIVQGTCNEHGIDFQFSSTPNAGTSVRIAIPAS